MARLLTQQPSMESNALGGDSAEEALLRDFPSDLICPITHQLFRDPVLTACGQVYERSAIGERHHATHAAAQCVTQGMTAHR
jgi:hypothetical protein